MVRSRTSSFPKHNGLLLMFRVRYFGLDYNLINKINFKFKRFHLNMEHIKRVHHDTLLGSKGFRITNLLTFKVCEKQVLNKKLRLWADLLGRPKVWILHWPAPGDIRGHGHLVYEGNSLNLNFKKTAQTVADSI